MVRDQSGSPSPSSLIARNRATPSQTVCSEAKPHFFRGYCDSKIKADNPSVPVLQAIKSAKPDPAKAELSRILRLHVPVIVKLAERKLLLSEVVESWVRGRSSSSPSRNEE